MRRLFTGIAFLSRIPLPGAATFDAADVGRATLTFPVVGALLGLMLVLPRHGLYPALPAPVASFLLLAVGALLTGALHLDGLADMADGFGGGHTKTGVAAVSALQGAGCLKKIGGITGDTMGANTEVCEVLVFVVLLGVGEG
jgi:cobalamin synthase